MEDYNNVSNWTEDQKKRSKDALSAAEKAIAIAGFKFVGILFATNCAAMFLGAIIMGPGIKHEYQNYYGIFAAVFNAILCERVFARKSKEISDKLKSTLASISTQQ